VYVTSKKCVPILGLDVSLALRFVQPGDGVNNVPGVKLKSIHTLAAVYDQQYPITMGTLKQEYTDVFTGLGCFPGKYYIHVSTGSNSLI
jgi:hypothetical protein